MKKKIIVISLCINLVASLFILYSFIPKEKKVGNEGTGSYIIVSADLYLGELFVADGTNIFDNKDLSKGVSEKSIQGNKLILAKELNDLSMKGYEVVSSFTQGGYNASSFVLKKK